MARESRLLVEQFINPRTTEAVERLVNRSFDRLAAGSLPRISSDGYDDALRAGQGRAGLPAAVGTGEEGQARRPPKPQTLPDPALLYATREGRRVTKVERKLVQGPPTTDLLLSRPHSLNGRPGRRVRDRYLVRKTYAFAKRVPYMDDQYEVDKTFYDFCRKHRGL